MEELKIAIVVHGRFHAFDLARALLNRGHDVTVFTNYPAYVAERFGVDVEHVETFLTHGLFARGMAKAKAYAGIPYPEATIHRAFGRWAARKVAAEQWDIVHCWSGVSEELIDELSDRPDRTVLMRGSSHIRTQDRLLCEEEERAGSSIDRPSQWIVEREKREYRAADHIAVLSSFAKGSFLDHGVAESKVNQYTLGVDSAAFRPSEETIRRRCDRLQSGEPIRVLFVGTLSYRKGLLDAIEIARSLQGGKFEFRFVGPVSPSFRSELPTLKEVADHVPNQPQSELPKWYVQSDVFLFPTIEDGFAMVLTQAQANGLPLLATTNCSGPDLIREGKNGWVLPIRSPDAFVERLRWCQEHRSALAEMVRHTYDTYQAPSWDDAAAEFEEVCAEALSANPG